MTKKPFVSIIIVNFNGRHLLDECLNSLAALTFPHQQFEVILVDNNSSDDSLPYIKKHFPWVKLIVNNQNLGFTGGNQVGFEHAKGDYLVLLNSDVVVDQAWLTELVAAAKPDRVGIVSSRLRYALPFVEVKIQSTVIPKSQIDHGTDHSPVGILVEDVRTKNDELDRLVYFKAGFYDKKNGEVNMRRIKGAASLLLPYPIQREQQTYTFTVHGFESQEKNPSEVTISAGKKLLSFQLQPFEVKQFQLILEKKLVEKNFTWLIQNAGNILLKNGYSKDRGSIIDVRNNEVKEFYEEENSYFEKKTELLSACGASCLIKRAVINKIGFLDGYYFMYYEDVEFSLRAWRAGWEIVYEPKSIGYHKHRATTGSSETSFLIEHLEQNHLAMVITHFPWLTVVSELTLFMMRFGMTSIKSFVFQFRNNQDRATQWHCKFEGRKAAFSFMVSAFPRLFLSRIKMAHLVNKSRKSFAEWLY